MKKTLLFLLSLGIASCARSDSDALSDPNTLLVSSFETLDGWLPDQQNATLTQEQAHSGKTALKVDEGHEYSLTYGNLLSRLHEGPIGKIKVSAWALMPNAQAAATLVTTVADPAVNNGKPVVWEGIELNKAVKQYGQWTEVSKIISLPNTITSNYRLSLYLWRTGGNQPVYIDDLKVAIVP